MRPKRRVLVWDANETSRRIRCYMLALWGYAVRGVGTVRELECAMEWAQVIVAVLPRRHDWASLRLAQALGVPVMSLDVAANPPGCPANISLASTAPPKEFREALRILSIRKRGPKRPGGIRETAKLQARVS